MKRQTLQEQFSELSKKLFSLLDPIEPESKFPDLLIRLMPRNRFRKQTFVDHQLQERLVDACSDIYAFEKIFLTNFSEFPVDESTTPLDEITADEAVWIIFNLARARRTLEAIAYSVFDFGRHLYGAVSLEYRFSHPRPTQEEREEIDAEFEIPDYLKPTPEEELRAITDREQSELQDEEWRHFLNQLVAYEDNLIYRCLPRSSTEEIPDLVFAESPEDFHQIINPENDLKINPALAWTSPILTYTFQKANALVNDGLSREELQNGIEVIRVIKLIDEAFMDFANEKYGIVPKNQFDPQQKSLSTALPFGLARTLNGENDFKVVVVGSDFCKFFYPRLEAIKSHSFFY